MNGSKHILKHIRIGKRQQKITNSSSDAGNLLSGVCSATKWSHSRSKETSFERCKKQQDDEAAQLIMMFGEPYKHICLKLTADDMIPAALSSVFAGALIHQEETRTARSRSCYCSYGSPVA
eukprot:scaffold8820_cov81-Cylindrotheca_fusiformis.AAC.1